MDKEIKPTERDVHMAIAKEPNSRVQQSTSNEHNRKVSKAIKEVTTKHPKLLKKLAE